MPSQQNDKMEGSPPVPEGPEGRAIIDVDVVMVSYNGGARLEQAVRSVLQDNEVRARVIIVDNDSTDGSIDAIEEPNATILRLPANVGYGAGFNAGLRYGSAPWVVCSNQDIAVSTGTLRTLIETVLSHEARTGSDVIASPRIVRPDGSTSETGHAIPTFRKACFALLVGAPGGRNVIEADPLDPQPVECGWVSAVFLLGRRSVFEKLNGFDPEYFMYVEDLDFFRRLRDRGGICVWDPRVCVVHYGGVGPEGRGAISAAMYARALWNIHRYFEKHEPRRGRLSGLAVLTAGAGGAAGRALLWYVRAARAGCRGAEDRTAIDVNAGGLARMFGNAALWCAIAAATGRLPSRLRSIGAAQREHAASSDQAGSTHSVLQVRPRAVFFARVRDLRLLDLIEFYAEDLRSLNELGFDVFRTNSVRAAVAAEGELLFAWWWHSSLPVMLAWRLRRRAVVATGTSNLFEPHSTRRVRWYLRSLLTAAGAQLPTVNIAVSEVELRKLRRIRAPKLECVRHAVDTEFFRPGPKETVPTGIVLAQIYRENIRRKGIDISILAAVEMARELRDFQLLVVGPSTADGAACLTEVCGGKLPDSVVVLGEVSRKEKQQLLAKAWFYLQPSVYEGFGVAVLEAMACGTAPICSRAGALPEVVGSAGVVLETVSTKSVASAAVGLARDGARLKELSDRARERSLTFDSKRHTAQLGTILRRHGILASLREDGSDRP